MKGGCRQNGDTQASSTSFSRNLFFAARHEERMRKPPVSTLLLRSVVFLVGGVLGAVATLAILASGLFPDEQPDGTAWGRFLGIPSQMEEAGPGKFKLLNSVTYVDPRGVEWDAPEDWVVNGADIPRWAWSVVGKPVDEPYWYPSVIHDVACDKQERPWRDVHEAFYYACRCRGMTEERAKVLYLAILCGGPRWQTLHIVDSSLEGLPVQVMTWSRGWLASIEEELKRIDGFDPRDHSLMEIQAKARIAAPDQQGKLDSRLIIAALRTRNKALWWRSQVACLVDRFWKGWLRFGMTAISEETAKADADSSSHEGRASGYSGDGPVDVTLHFSLGAISREEPIAATGIVAVRIPSGPDSRDEGKGAQQEDSQGTNLKVQAVDFTMHRSNTQLITLSGDDRQVTVAFANTNGYLSLECENLESLYAPYKALEITAVSVERLEERCLPGRIAKPELSTSIFAPGKKCKFENRVFKVPVINQWSMAYDSTVHHLCIVVRCKLSK